jgi:hypothetical protein
MTGAAAGEPSTFADAERVAREAYHRLRAGDRETASRLADDALVMIDGGQGTAEQHSDALHRLAGVFRGLGDKARCESTARSAIKVEETCDRPMMLGNHRMFLADFLSEQRRFAEATKVGRAAIPCFESAFGPAHSQTIRVRADVDRFAKEAALSA